MEKKTPKKSTEQSKKEQSRGLDALDFLATTAGQLKTEQNNYTPPSSSSAALTSMDFLSMPQFALPSSVGFSPYSSQGSSFNHPAFVNSFTNPFLSRFGKNEYDGFNGKPPGFPLKPSTVKELVDSCITSRSSPPLSKNPNFFMNSALPSLHRMSSPPVSLSADMYQQSLESVKSAFKVVHHHQKTAEETQNDHIALSKTATPTATNVPEQPPKLYRMEMPEAKSNSLFDTLVKETQKLLSSQQQNEKKLDGSTNGERESVIKEDKSESPHKKVIRKRKPKNLANGNSDSTKRAYGGPPFNPGASPPKPNTPESALCTLHEHTLLKMATRGFWSGDRGPLQDVFRLTRVENSDLQYSINDITQHCYNVVKRKLENALHGSEERDIMRKHMRCYVDELDSYLDRIYPVSSVAINIYLPTAMDYAAATWHGIVPTGWSEYRRAVVIRQVFEVLYHLSAKFSVLPAYQKNFFHKKIPDPTLYPTNSPTPSFTTNETTKKLDNNANNVLPEESEVNPEYTVDDLDIKFSRAFEALWTHTSPHEPFLILDDTSQLKLREYFEKFPVETDAPPDNAIIVIDDKKYKARQILGFFRRGVQLVDYSKETGTMIVDTISTIQRTSITSAVRKIPPGKISKLIHPDLHLENYTNAILQVGVVNADNSNDTIAQPTGKFRTRKRRVKIGSSSSTSSAKKVKDEEIEKQMEEEPLTPDVRKLDSIAAFCEPLQAKTETSKDNPLAAFQYHPFYSSTGSSGNSNNNTNLKIYPETPPYEASAYEQMISPSDIDIQRRQVATKRYWDSFLNQTTSPNFMRTKPEIPNYHTPDILQSMYKPPTTPTPTPPQCNSDMFSLHLMIDSYRRAAKYLLDTANHLELVAKRGGNLPPAPPTHSHPTSQASASSTSSASHHTITKREEKTDSES